jgi:hypothetical protein
LPSGAKFAPSIVSRFVVIVPVTTVATVTAVIVTWASLSPQAVLPWSSRPRLSPRTPSQRGVMYQNIAVLLLPSCAR